MDFIRKSPLRTAIIVYGFDAEVLPAVRPTLLQAPAVGSVGYRHIHTALLPGQPPASPYSTRSPAS